MSTHSRMMFYQMFSAVTDIDTSGIHALEDLYKSLQKRDIQVHIINKAKPERL